MIGVLALSMIKIKILYTLYFLILNQQLRKISFISIVLLYTVVHTVVFSTVFKCLYNHCLYHWFFVIISKTMYNFLKVARFVLKGIWYFRPFRHLVALSFHWSTLIILNGKFLNSNAAERSKSLFLYTDSSSYGNT